MHWHPHADEWQYYRERPRPHDRLRLARPHAHRGFRNGHVAFIKQGYGHYIEQVGDQPTRILILFNSGLYQEISLTNWLGGNPNSLLTSNFGISQDMLDRLPKKEVGILGKKS